MTSASDNESFTEKIFKEITSDRLFIGKGAFGDVYGPCIWKSKTYAIKKRMFGTDATQSAIEKQLVACKIWKSLLHRNLMTVYEVSLESPALYILMEYAAGGSLQAVLEQRTTDLPLEILMDWGTQIAEGMAYLHQQMIVHRDLKSPNSKFYTIFDLQLDGCYDPSGPTVTPYIFLLKFSLVQRS